MLEMTIIITEILGLFLSVVPYLLAIFSIIVIFRTIEVKNGVFFYSFRSYVKFPSRDITLKT